MPIIDKTQLDELGFKASPDDAEILILDLKTHKERTFLPDTLIASLNSLHIKQEKDVWIPTETSFLLSFEKFNQELIRCCKEKLGQTCEVAIQPGDHQSLWIFMEFTRTRGTKEASQNHEITDIDRYPHGILGVQIRLSIKDGYLSLYFGEHFILGYHPTKTLSVLQDIILSSWGFQQAPAIEKGLFEVKFNIVAEISSWEDQLSKELPGITFTEVGKRQISLDHRHKNDWIITVSHKKTIKPSIDMIPLELIESRTFQEQSIAIDQLILKNKLSAAKKICMDSRESGDTSAFLFRRICLISFWERRPLHLQQTDEMLALYPQNLIFHATAVQAALAHNDPDRLLKALSSLGELLRNQGLQIDSIPIFDMVIPELLGDGWRSSDNRMALTCYNHVLKKRGDVIRVLRKIAAISQEANDTQTEMDTLLKLNKLEKSQAKSAKILYRMAVLSQEKDPQMAANNALLAWNLAPQDYDLGIFTAACMDKTGDHQQGIQILEECAEAAKKQKQRESQAKVERLLAAKWLEFFDRQDMAKERLRKAIAASPESIQNLKDCDVIATQIHEPSLLLDLQEKIFFLAIEKGESQLVLEMFDNLMEIYKEAEDSDMKRCLLTQTLMEHYLLDYKTLQKIVRDDDITIDWVKFIQNTRNQVMQEKWEKRKPYLSLLADIAKSKLDNRSLAAELYEICIEHGDTDHHTFDFLSEYYSSKQAYDKHDNILKKKLKNAQKEHRKEILVDLCYNAKTLTEPESDTYSIMLFEEFHDDESLKRRIASYQKSKNLVAIDSIFEELQFHRSNDNHQKKLLEYTLEIVRVMADDDRFRVINNLLICLKDSYSDYTEWLTLAIDCLNHKSEKSDDIRLNREYLGPYLEKLIISGIIPDSPEGYWLNYLKEGSHALGIYLVQLANSSEDTKSKLPRLKEALNIFKDDNKFDPIKIEIYQAISQLEVLPFKDLNKYYQLAKESHVIDLFMIGLASQIKKVVLDSDYRNMKDMILKVIMEQDSAYIEPIQDFIKLVKTFDASSIQDIHISLLSQGTKYHQLIDIDWGIDYLSTMENFIDNPQSCQNLLKIVLNGSNTHQDLISTNLIQYQKMALERGDFETLRNLVDMSLDFNIGKKSLVKTLLLESLNQLEAQNISQYWNYLTIDIDNLEEWRSLLGQVRQRATEESSIFSILQASFETIQKFNDSIANEIQIEYGLELFHRGIESETAQQLLKKAYNLDNNDSRIWTALFELNENLGYSESNFYFLADILPKIEEDPSVLDASPLTLDSLVKSYMRIGKENNFSTHLTSSLAELGLETEDEVLLPPRSKAGSLNDTIIVAVEANDPIQQNIQANIPKPINHGQNGDKDHDFAAKTVPAMDQNLLPDVEVAEYNQATEENRFNPRHSDDDSPIDHQVTKISVRKPDPDDDNSLKPSPNFASEDTKITLTDIPLVPVEPLEPKSPEENFLTDYIKISQPEDDRLPNQHNDSTASWRTILNEELTINILPKLYDLEYPTMQQRYLAYQGGVFHDNEDEGILNKFDWMEYVNPAGFQGIEKYMDQFPLTSWIKNFSSIIEKNYQDSHSISHIAKKFSVDTDTFLRSRSPINFTQLFAWPWADRYNKQLERLQLKIFLLEGNQTYAYERGKNALYLSKDLTVTPNPFLLILILFHLRSIQGTLFEVIFFPEIVRKTLGHQLKFLSNDASRQLAKILGKNPFQNQINLIRRRFIGDILEETRNLADTARFEAKIFYDNNLPVQRKQQLLADFSKIDEDS